MNAADRYGLEDLRKSCHGFIQSCINVDTVCALLQTADRYVQYKCTKAFLKQVRKELNMVNHPFVCKIYANEKKKISILIKNTCCFGYKRYTYVMYLALNFI